MYISAHTFPTKRMENNLLHLMYRGGAAETNSGENAYSLTENDVSCAFTALLSNRFNLANHSLFAT